MMKIQFSNKNMTVPDRVYSHAEQRINELDHLFRGEPEAVVVFSAEDGKHVIELTIFSGTTILRVVEKTSDMLVSIDAAVSSIRRQLRELRRWTALTSRPIKWCAPSSSSLAPCPCRKPFCR